jgi:hypothetical protein
MFIGAPQQKARRLLRFVRAQRQKRAGAINGHQHLRAAFA